jgi:restriction system protein
VRDALSKRVVPIAKEVVSLVRLDLIDVALYQAISTHPELLHTLNWRTFEELMADILRTFEFEVELQRGTKDGGVDLFAVKRMYPMGPQRFLLQAKRWKNSVGIEPVRELAFLHSHHKVNKSCLATTATFTRGAWNLANQYRWQLELCDFERLLEWVREAAKIRLRSNIASCIK